MLYKYTFLRFPFDILLPYVGPLTENISEYLKIPLPNVDQPTEVTRSCVQSEFLKSPNYFISYVFYFHNNYILLYLCLPLKYASYIYQSIQSLGSILTKELIVKDLRTTAGGCSTIIYRK